MSLNKSGIFRVGALAGLVMAVLWGDTVQASARNYYGAIAYSTSGAYGAAYNYRSRSGAEREALRQCRRSGRGCSTRIWFRNGCGALATGSGGWGAGWGGTIRAAKRQALSACRRNARGCATRRWVCTTR